MRAPRGAVAVCRLRQASGFLGVFLEPALLAWVLLCKKQVKLSQKNIGKTPMGRNRALVLDDNCILAKVLQKYLKAQGLDVDLAASIRQARNCLLGNRYSMIVMDVRLPDGNAVDLVEQLRGHLADCQIVFMTGDHDEDWRARAERLRAHAYLEKPFALSELRRFIERTRTQAQDLQVLAS